jgi:hypothetical protein
MDGLPVELDSTVLQMDQAAPAHQGVRWHLRERRQIALDRGLSYVLVALKKRLALPASLHEILQILGLTLFEKTPVNGLFDDDQSQKIPAADANQLNLFN